MAKVIMTEIQIVPDGVNPSVVRLEGGPLGQRKHDLSCTFFWKAQNYTVLIRKREEDRGWIAKEIERITGEELTNDDISALADAVGLHRRF